MGKYFIIIGFFGALAGGIGFLPTFIMAYKSLLQSRMTLEMKKLRREAGYDEIPKNKLKNIKMLCALQTITDMLHSSKVMGIVYAISGIVLALSCIGFILGIIFKFAGIIE